MPIKIQSDLPVKEILEKENIFVMDESRASHQDIRPIQILILNLMPLKEETELQLLRSLSNTPLQVDVTFMAVQSHEAKNTSVSHLNKFYQTFPELKNNKYDGMIITGAPVEQMEFEEVDYWKELVEIMQYLSFKQGDKTDLNKVIELAQTLDLSKYLSEGQDRFTAALENAKGVSANKDAMQEEVDQTWKELLSAMSELRVKPDKSALENLISQAENIDTANYTKESGQVFHKALAQAIKVYQNAEADQQDVDNAVRTLKAAEDSLVAKADGDQQEEKSGISTGNSSNVTKNSETKNSGVRSAKTGDKTQAGALALVMLLSVFAVARTRKERNM